MSNPLALIVDDEPDIRELLEITLARMNIDARTADSLESAQALLRKEKFQLCLTDMNLPDGSGITLVQTIQREYPNLPVAVITAYGSMEAAVASLKAGAFDFVSKPVELTRLRDMVNTALKLRTNDELPAEDSRLLGRSPVMQELREKIHKLSRSQAPVYICGESGTGKELVARLIHELGPRSEHAFVPVNCGAIPSELMESEFFGYKKGSFTGANEDKKGLFQAAHEGTLFLDEVADLPLAMQVKLLRAIQEKSIRPVGHSKEMAVNVRILSATHKDLAAEVEAGRFRQDLFYRINVIQVKVPPLRERAEDILYLAKSILRKLSAEWGIPEPTLGEDAQRALQHYTFPGNVRELQNILERALTLCDTNVILPEHLQLPNDALIHTAAATEPAPSAQELKQTPAATSPSAEAHNGSLEDFLFEIEKTAILKALEETRWNRTAAARKLGMTFRSLRYRLKKMGLDDEEE